MRVDKGDALFGGVFIFLGVIWLITGPYYYRSRAQKIGESLTSKQLIKDELITLTAFGFGFIKLADSNYFSAKSAVAFNTLGIGCIIGYILSLYLIPTRTTDEKYRRWKILKEIEESPDGISISLRRHSESAGRMKWVFLTLLFLLGGALLLFVARDQPLTTLAFLFFIAVLICCVYLSMTKIEQRDPSQLPPGLR